MNEIQNIPEQNPLALLGQMDMATIDPDKLGKLLDLQSVWEDRKASKAHSAAVVAFQSEMPQVQKNRSVQGKYNYASYDDIMRIARPILQKNGLAISFSQTEDEKTITITARITHAEGHSVETPLTMPKLAVIQSRSGQDVTNVAQAMGSTLQYAKRYCLCNALDIVVTDEDDDCQAAAAPEPVTQAQGDEIAGLATQAEELSQGSRQRFLDYAGVKSFYDIPADKAEHAIDLLNRKIAELSKEESE